jgi:hypothetical protein
VPQRELAYRRGESSFDTVDRRSYGPLPADQLGARSAQPCGMRRVEQEPLDREGNRPRVDPAMNRRAAVPSALTRGQIS